ncbi:NAD(P)H-quinone oxidoreductase subunit L, chloroplastic-like isoform X3 [Miscanthus floridulus]|uniref:NAD(P)H-quinone oxidoreductase subunit L, chloroplastic-like isoform X3 n=1 Tax=Miscanthus floridulus TaxID=154761 RepID=UPI0034587146
MDTAAASWRLLSPASSSPPPCPQKLPKRQATFAASPLQPQQSASSSAKFRLLCLLHDKSAAPTMSVQQSSSQLQRLAAVLQCGAVWAAVEAPAALATVTGEEDLDLLGILPPIAAFAVFYLFVAPVRQLLSSWFPLKATSFGLHAPELMLWAPFVNFRKFPRDPTMKYPWSKPKEGTPLFKDRYPPIDSYKP